MIDLIGLSGVQALRIFGVILVTAAIYALMLSMSDSRWQTDVNAIATKMYENYAHRTTRYGAGCYVTSQLIAGNMMPSNVVSGTSALNEWGGVYEVCGNTNTVLIYTENVPQDQCIRVLTQVRSVQRVVSVWAAGTLTAAKAVAAGARLSATTDIALASANTACAATVNTIGFEVR